MIAPLSIIIPCYNHNRELLTALASLCRLKILPYEVIVIDDGSERAVQFDNSLYPFTVTTIRTQNRGLAAARNEGIRQASQEWILFLDADDTLLPEALDICVNLFPGDALGAVQQAYRLHQENQQHDVFPAVGDPISALLQCNLGPPHSFIFSIHALKRLEGFNECETYREGHEDYELLTRLIIAGYRLISHHLPACEYFKYPGSMSSFRDNMLRTQLRVWQQFFLQIDEPTVQRTEQALSFFSMHYQSYCASKELNPKDIQKKLIDWLKVCGAHIPTLKYLIRAMPESLQLSFIEAASSHNKVWPVLQEVFDWRAQNYHMPIAVWRFYSCCEVLQQERRLIIWGYNDIARTVARFLDKTQAWVIVDGREIKQRFLDRVVQHKDELRITNDDIFFIAAHKYFDQIKAKLTAQGIDESRIF